MPNSRFESVLRRENRSLDDGGSFILRVALAERHGLKGEQGSGIADANNLVGNNCKARVFAKDKKFQ